MPWVGFFPFGAAKLLSSGQLVLSQDLYINKRELDRLVRLYHVSFLFRLLFGFGGDLPPLFPASFYLGLWPQALPALASEVLGKVGELSGCGETMIDLSLETMLLGTFPDLNLKQQPQTRPKESRGIACLG
jgi:hypothetical protein